jgi:hypothetical protein
MVYSVCEQGRRAEEKPTKNAVSFALDNYGTLFKSPHTITSGLLFHGATKQVKIHD